MMFLDKLDYLMKIRKLNKHTLSEQSGIPYTTIDGWYKKGYEGAKISTIIKLSDFFGVELDFFVRNSISPHDKKEEARLPSVEESELLLAYRSLNKAGQTTLVVIARAFVGSPSMQKEEVNEDNAILRRHADNTLVENQAFPDSSEAHA